MTDSLQALPLAGERLSEHFVVLSVYLVLFHVDGLVGRFQVFGIL